jgi:hypothetical protein
MQRLLEQRVTVLCRPPSADPFAGLAYLYATLTDETTIRA